MSSVDGVGQTVTATATAPSVAGYVVGVERSIIGYHQDEVGDWVAELDCGHNQHVRHRPPFQLRAWALDPKGRVDRLGTNLECRLCERAEIPETLRSVRTTPVWDQASMPAGLRRAHRVAAGTWGRIVVYEGRLRFTAATTPAIEIELGAGVLQGIPPGVEHCVEPLGAVRFAVEFFTVDRASRVSETREWPDEGGDPACWAQLVCPECGAIAEGGSHRAGCPASGTTT